MADAVDPVASYKQRKEDFVSNLSGGSVTEICLVTAAAPVAMVLWGVLQSRQRFFNEYWPLAFLVDFYLSVAVILLSFTINQGAPMFTNGMLLAPAILIYALPTGLLVSRKKPRVPPKAQPKSDLGVLSTKPFLTTYRGSMMVATCLAILAVDFKVFPRRFAKVETWGTSLMDIGVGSFVFSAGIVAARPVLKDQAEGKSTPLTRRLLGSLRHSLPLLVLGFVRLLSVKGLDYAEHVSEYGVHWNFFFTLGFLPPFVAIFQSALKIIPSYAGLAVLLGVAYQVALESTTLKAFILTAPRTDLVSMNREGIFSFVGYLAIFLAGQDTGMFVLPRNINSRGSSASTAAGKQRTTLPLTLAVWTLVWSALYFFSTDYTYGAGLTVSRRLANLPYMLWVVAFNSAQILAFCLVDTVLFPAFYRATDAKVEKAAHDDATSRILRAYNRNGLAVFLVANLLTGLVNMTVPTLDVPFPNSMWILAGYAAVITGFAMVLDAYNISLKL